MIEIVTEVELSHGYRVWMAPDSSILLTPPNLARLTGEWLCLGTFETAPTFRLNSDGRGMKADDK